MPHGSAETKNTVQQADGQPKPSAVDGNQKNQLAASVREKRGDVQNTTITAQNLSIHESPDRHFNAQQIAPCTQQENRPPYLLPLLSRGRGSFQSLKSLKSQFRQEATNHKNQTQSPENQSSDNAHKGTPAHHSNHYNHSHHSSDKHPSCRSTSGVPEPPPPHGRSTTSPTPSSRQASSPSTSRFGLPKTRAAPIPTSDSRSQHPC